MMSLTVTRMYGKQQQAAIPSQLSSLTSSNQSAARWVTGQQHSPGVSTRSHSHLCPVSSHPCDTSRNPECVTSQGQPPGQTR